MTQPRLFGTDGIRGKAGAYPLTPEDAKKLGRAFGQFLKKGKEKGMVVAIGVDTRASSPMLQDAVADGLRQEGVNIMLLGVLPTNAVSYLAKHYDTDGAVMITASHNPAGENGIKFLREDGSKLNEKEEEQVETLFYNGKSPAAKVKGGLAAAATARKDYLSFLEGAIKEGLSGMSVIVDCGNGVTSGIAREAFTSVGVKAQLMNALPDGNNINLDCGAVYPEKMAGAVKRMGADVGVAFDGDADRAVFSDEKGNILTGDHVMAIVALALQGKGKLKGSTLVVTDYSNSALDALMAKSGIKVLRVKTGDKNVAEAMEKFGYSFGGEESGHYIFKEYSGMGDGLLTALQILSIINESGKPLSQLSSVLNPYPSERADIVVARKTPIEQTKKVSKAIRNASEALKGKGRVFVRYSGTETKLRILVEGKDGKEIKALAAKIAEAAREELA